MIHSLHPSGIVYVGISSAYHQTYIYHDPIGLNQWDCANTEVIIPH